MLKEDHRLYWIWMAESFGQGSTTAAALIRRYKTPQAFFTMTPADFRDEKEFRANTVEKIRKILQKPSLARAAEILSRCDMLGITVLTPEDDSFPEPLRNIRNMPMVLYMRGVLPDCTKTLFTAIVGTRKMTDYGRRIAYSLGAGLAFGGAVVVSGMALGADSMALIGALDAGGTVIAVLGSGVDVIYPADHKEIYRKITERGAVISEYPPGTRPIGKHFPVRNRLMSGISDAAVVVEADADSGAMITAEHAIEQGRKLFAVPGNIGDSGAEGPNLLLREGAIPALCAEDILCEFEFVYGRSISIRNAQAGLRGADLDTLSKNAMARARIGIGKDTPGADKNYYGNGSYGGRAPKQEEVQPQSLQSERKESPAGLQSERQKARKTEAENKSSKKESRNAISGLFGSIRENIRDAQEEKAEKTDKKMIPAKKIELEMLDENEIKVYNKMKPDVPMLPDELADGTTSIADVMSALTVLELSGAVEAGSGGYFKRVSPDDIMQSIND